MCPQIQETATTNPKAVDYVKTARVQQREWTIENLGIKLEDTSLREDILDIVLIQQRQGESSRPFSEYLAERKERGG